MSNVAEKTPFLHEFIVLSSKKAALTSVH